MPLSRSLFPPHLLHLPLFFLFSLLPAAYADLAADRSALLLLSSSIPGHTLRWNQSQSDPCAWRGISCNNFTRRVVELRLPGDGLSGQIPPGSIGNLTQLQVLSLRQNSLSGQIPSDIGFCTQLRQINLRGNQFSGQIPATLFNLTNLISLDFSGNNLLGEIPTSFNNLIQLQTMYLENNQFNGVIPNLTRLPQLSNFNVSNNRLTGPIPLSLIRFPSDSFLGNTLCGSPLKACTDGDGNGNGNGRESSSVEKTLSGGEIAGIVIGSFCGLIIVLSVMFIVWRKISIENLDHEYEPEPRERPSALPVMKLGSIKESDGNTGLVRAKSCIETGKEGGAVGSDDDGLIFLKAGDGDGDWDRIGAGAGAEVKSFKLQQLLMAAAEVMGKGRFGTTYRVYLGGDEEDDDDDDDDDDERKEKKKKKKKNVIVKRLKDVCVNIGEREFRERVEAIGRLKHENLVPLLAYFYGKDERLLVYDDLGSRVASLASVLHGGRDEDEDDDDDIRSLTWEIRGKVMLEIAKAIEYLHSYSSDSDPYFSHGNINSSNVLLPIQYTNNKMKNKFIISSATAYLSEFGISPLISSSSSSNNGYWAPEVVDSRRMTQKADVYSFGVLILELVTGKDPNGGGMDLARWVHDSVVVKDGYRSIHHQVFDQELVQHPSHQQQQQQQMVELVYLGISCTSKQPYKRPSIFQVSKRIHLILSVQST